MKTLFIVRHGKSSWEYDDVKDVDRPLSERGIHDAHTMAGRLKKKNVAPARMISSPAARALHTAMIFKRILEIPDHHFSVDTGLYQADTPGIMDVIYGVDPQVDSLMIFGHNPSFTDLANELSGLRLDNMPTAGVLAIDFNVEKWTRLSSHDVTGHLFEYPKKA